MEGGHEIGKRPIMDDSNDEKNLIGLVHEGSVKPIAIVLVQSVL